MKGAGKFLIMIGIISALLLLYVHVQVNIFQVSYSLESKSKNLVKRYEDFRRLKFQVEQLKAPQRLSDKLKTSDLSLEMPKEIHLVEMPASAALHELPPVEKPTFQPLSRGLLDFLGHWVKVAQAETNSH